MSAFLNDGKNTLIIKLLLKLKFTMKNVVLTQKSSNKRIYIWSNIHIMGERIETGEC